MRKGGGIKRGLNGRGQREREGGGVQVVESKNTDGYEAGNTFLLTGWDVDPWLL